MLAPKPPTVHGKCREVLAKNLDKRIKGGVVGERPVNHHKGRSMALTHTASRTPSVLRTSKRAASSAMPPQCTNSVRRRQRDQAAALRFSGPRLQRLPSPERSGRGDDGGMVVAEHGRATSRRSSAQAPSSWPYSAWPERESRPARRRASQRHRYTPLGHSTPQARARSSASARTSSTVCSAVNSEVSNHHPSSPKPASIEARNAA